MCIKNLNYWINVFFNKIKTQKIILLFYIFNRITCIYLNIIYVSLMYPINYLCLSTTFIILYYVLVQQFIITIILSVQICFA